MRLVQRAALAAALALVACNGDTGASPAGGVQDGTADGGGQADGAGGDAGGAGDTTDAGTPGDAGTEDAGTGDAGTGDVGTGDAGPGDAGTGDAVDAAAPDATDAGPDAGAPLLACCSAAEPCAADLVCAPIPGGAVGVCQVPPGDGCWSDGDCEPTEACDGVTLCPCTADCAEPDAPGACVPKELPEGCCLTDEDCDTGTDMAWSCARPDPAEPGRCVPAPDADECWDDGDCAAGEHCQGSSLCPCGAVCGVIEAPGVCVAVQQLLCSGACDDASMTCVGDVEPPAELTTIGQCRPAAEPGRCWEPTDCEGDQICVGAVWCQPGTYCLANEHPGRCLEPVEAGSGACWADADCIGDAPALCVGAFVPLALEDPVVPFPGACCTTAPGACWQDSHCPVGEHCEGANLPLPDACTDALGGAEAGACVTDGPWPEELCLSDAECGGATCVGEWTCPLGAHCIDGPYRGLCLTPAAGCREAIDCGGPPCDGAFVCDVLGGEMCGGAMASAGTCGSLEAGDVCLQVGACGEGLSCCYMCGIPGCPFTCTPTCDPGDPLCSGGCPVGIP